MNRKVYDAYMNAAEINLDTINELLCPIGLVAKHDFSQITVHMDATGKMMCFKCNSNGMICIGYVFDTCNELLLMLLAEIEYFSCVDNNNETIVKNPYFGCLNIEEAMIKKDIEFTDHPNIFETE